MLVSGEKPGFQALSKGLSPAVFIVKLVNLLFSVCFAAGYIHFGEIKIFTSIGSASFAQLTRLPST